MVTLIATAVDNPDVKAEVTIEENYGVYWEIDPNGHITQRDTRQMHKANRLYAIDKSGRETGAYIEMKDTDILEQLAIRHSVDLDEKAPNHLKRIRDIRYAVTNSSEAGRIFIFASNNTDVEWGLLGVNTQGGRRFIITTSHNKREVHPARINRLAGFDEFQIAFDIHSHPGEDGTKGASGTRVIGDVANINERDKRFHAQGISLPPHYVYHKHSRTLYQYTPSESSIDKGVIRNNDGLNSIMHAK